MANKARYWCGILYPENMIKDWHEEIGDLLQLPYCYCVHDRDRNSDGETRKTHVHLIIVFPNTTTYKHAMTVFNSLSGENDCLSTCEPVFNVRHMYNYLIHDTDTCKKKGKFLYHPSDRISGNNFDIGSFEQLSIAEKEDIAQELCDIIVQQGFTNFVDFYMYVRSNTDSSYFSVFKSYSGMFERLCKGNFLKGVNDVSKNRKSQNFLCDI